MEPKNNIHPIFDQLLDREQKEERLKQRAKLLWMTGLSGSGKSTIAQALEKRLFHEGFFTIVLDGDNIRSGINKNLGFSIEDRKENIRRISEISKLFLRAGVVTINSSISPTREIRDFARDIVGTEDFVLIYVNAPLEVCEERDVKGLYQKARDGEIDGFTGIDSPFEAPEEPDLEIRTDELSVEESVDKIVEYILPKIRLGGEGDK